MAPMAVCLSDTAGQLQEPSARVSECSRGGLLVNDSSLFQGHVLVQIIRTYSILPGEHRSSLMTLLSRSLDGTSVDSSASHRSRLVSSHAYTLVDLFQQSRPLLSRLFLLGRSMLHEQCSHTIQFCLV